MRVPGAALPGRGRWKIGCPGTGRPGTERIGAPASAVGEAGLGGALYTGRGPVWGTIMRGDGVCERGGATGAAGFAATTGGGTADGGATETGGAACATVVVAAVGWPGRAGTGMVAGGAADGWVTGGEGTENVGLIVAGGRITLGGGTAAEVGGAGAFTAGADGEAATTGRTGGAATLAGACCLRIAFRTSPGLEILERSILVLISSLSTRVGRACLVEACASLVPRK